MRTPYVVAGVIIVILVLGAVFYWANNNAPASPSAQTQVQNSVAQPGNSVDSNTNAIVPNNGLTVTVSSSIGTATPQDQVTVTETDAGFAPGTITITKGTTIIFKNGSSNPIRPASDPHPAHTDYPTRGGCVASTFDACRAVAPGDSWSFKFDIVGTWGYHDHFNPAHKGTVVVQ